MELKKNKENIRCCRRTFQGERLHGKFCSRFGNRLNIKAASLYAHIRSKEEILEWICFGIAQEFFDELQEVKIQYFTKGKAQSFH
jgi:hypothetical protein